jgi:hypothetical protein
MLVTQLDAALCPQITRGDAADHQRSRGRRQRQRVAPWFQFRTPGALPSGGVPQAQAAPHDAEPASRSSARKGGPITVPTGIGGHGEALWGRLTRVGPPQIMSRAEPGGVDWALASRNPARWSPEDRITGVEYQYLGTELRPDRSDQLGQQTRWTCWRRRMVSGVVAGCIIVVRVHCLSPHSRRS